MRRVMVTCCALLIVAGAIGTPALAAKRPVTKRAAAKKVTRGVKGTAQLPGDNGKIGVTYTMGKGDEAINFTLLSAEYAASRITVDDSDLIPNADEKFVVLHYTVQNPNHVELGYNWGTLRFTAIGSDNVNRNMAGNGTVVVGKEGTSQSCSMTLKPAQKIAVYTLLRLPAAVSVPKLMVQHGDDVPVLRVYFAKGHIKGLAAPIADPADSTGAVARTDVPAEREVYYPLGVFDVKLVSAKLESQAIGSVEPEEGGKLLVATIGIKNATSTKRSLNWATFGVSGKTTDADALRADAVLKGGRDAEFGAELDPGEETTARVISRVPKGATVGKLTLWEGEDGRKFTFDLKDVK